MSVEEKKKELKDNIFEATVSCSTNLDALEILECILEVSEAMLTTFPDSIKDKKYTATLASTALIMLSDFHENTKRKLIDKYLSKIRKGH